VWKPRLVASDAEPISEARASERMTELGFSPVPWQPVLDQRIGRHIAGVMRGDDSIEWELGRKIGLGL
jgi:hypothetical protein